jgi:hypothetical protein
VRKAFDVLTGLARSYLFEDVDRDAPLAAQVTIRHLVRGESLWRLSDLPDEICVVLDDLRVIPSSAAFTPTDLWG